MKISPAALDLENKESKSDDHTRARRRWMVMVIS